MAKTTGIQKIPCYSLQQVLKDDRHFAIQFFKGDFQKRKEDFLLPHRKNYYTFILVRKGSSRHWVDMIPYTLRANTLYVSTPWQVQVKEEAKPFEGVIISFTEMFLNLEESRELQQLPVIQNPYNCHELILQEHDIVFMEELMHKIQQEYDTTSSWRDTMIRSYLKVLAIYISRLYNEQFESRGTRQERLLLKKFQKAIDKNFTRLHQVADYAQHLHLTSGYLNEVIKGQSGKTAIQHIHERLIMEARRKLFHTEFSVKEIAYQLGFDDAAYFHRFFKRITGQTPNDFRYITRKMYS